MAADRTRKRRPSANARNTATKRSVATRRDAAAGWRRDNQVDYRYQNIVQSPNTSRSRMQSRIQGGFDPPWARFRQPITITAAVIVLVLAVLLIPNAVGSCAESPAATEGAARLTRATTAREQDIAYSLNASDLLAIPGSPDVLAFGLNGGVETSAFQGESLRFIESTLSDIRELGSCGFVFLDVDTGRGLAYNADEALYIASAAKAPLAFYAVQHGAAGSEADNANIEQAILYSDNDAFEAFGYNYTDEEYSSWLAAHEVFHEEYYYDLYPPMSARSLAAIWAEIYEFAQSSAPDAGWFANLLASTDTSFIRDGLHGQDTLVMNKAGWIASEDGEYQSVSDAAIIQAGDRTYLMAIVTSQPDWGMTEANVATLARVLFDARDEF